jgi:hypothetical protein
MALTRLCQPLPNHAVFLYRDPETVAAVVARFLDAGLVAGEAAMVLTSRPRWEALQAALSALGHDVDALIGAGVLVGEDGDLALARVLAAGCDASALRVVLGPVLDGVRRATKSPAIRAYSDLVNTLWERADLDAALRLEHAWHDLVAGQPIRVLCGYGADPMAADTDATALYPLCWLHGRIHAPADADARGAALEAGLADAMTPIERDRLTVVMTGDGLPLDDTSGDLRSLWLRTRMPHLARRVLARAAVLLGHHAAVPTGPPGLVTPR